MAPPQSVAVASAIPTNYFAGVSGAAASVPVTHTVHGHIQPVNIENMAPTRLIPMPTTFRDAMDRAVKAPVRIVQPGALPGLPSGFQQLFNNGINRFQSPLSWWQGQFKTRGFGRWL